MTDRDIRRKAHEIRRKYRGLDSYREVREAAGAEGYTVIAFRRANNLPEVDVVKRNLHLEDEFKTERGFTYADRHYRLIFICEDLTDDEKQIVLLHELCHIWLGHMKVGAIVGLDVQQEYEANELCHYLLHPGRGGMLCKRFTEHKKAYIACLLLIVVIACAFAGCRQMRVRQTYYGEYYVTENGTKYHLKDCMTLRGSTTLRRLTKEDMESGKYKPCGVCLPGR